MAKVGGNPENLRPNPDWVPGVSGNPSGQPKEAANLRVLWQRMWGLYYTDEAAYAELAAKYPKIATQIEARARQAKDGNTAAIVRVDTEGVGPLKTGIDINDLSKWPKEALVRLVGEDE